MATNYIVTDTAVQGFDVPAIISGIRDRSLNTRDGWYSLVFESAHSTQATHPKVDLQDHDLPAIDEESLRKWLPAIASRYGSYGRRLAFAFVLYEQCLYAECCRELQTILDTDQSIEGMNRVVVFLLYADALMLLGSVAESVSRLRDVYSFTLRQSFSMQQRHAVLLVIAESLLQLDLPSLADEILSPHFVSSRSEDRPVGDAVKALQEWSHRHSIRDLTRVNNLYCKSGEILDYHFCGLSGLVALRMRRFQQIDPASSYSINIQDHIRKRISSGEDVLSAMSLAVKPIPAGMSRSILGALARTSDDVRNTDTIALHLLFNNLIDSPAKRLAHLLWSKSSVQEMHVYPNDHSSDASGGGDLRELLDAATRQESMLRDEYMSIMREFQSRQARISEVDALREDLVKPILRIQAEIEQLLGYKTANSDGVEARIRLQKTADAMQRDIEDLLVRINRKTP